MPGTSLHRFVELDFLAEVEAGALDVDSLAAHALNGLSRLVGFDFGTLGACDLRRGRRRVIGSRPSALDAARLAAFDRHFFEHPFVRAQGLQRRRGVQRISDVVDIRDFQRSSLFDEYYRPLRIRHVLAIPLEQTEDIVTSFVMNRSGRDFSMHEMLLLERLRPHLAFLLRYARSGVGRASTAGNAQRATNASPLRVMPFESVTPREVQVLGWVGAGKSNAEIGAILGISGRTVDKHLANAYPKLGVETRTAAVVRALELGLVPMRESRTGKMG
jgi:DNA-binding CsgD family transcriptional regulator